MEGSPSQGNRRVAYREEGAERSTPYSWYGVAPAGHFTQWQGSRPQTLAGAKLLETFELAQQDHVIHSQELVSEDWPYLTFEARSFHPRARWVERDDMWTGRYTVHAADPRVSVEGIQPREPWFNAVIAVSHRWLTPDNPDPDGAQHRELMSLCEHLGLHDSQSFLIDYCSLPQHPRTPAESERFRQQLPGFQERFRNVIVVLNTGSSDYSRRAWCMFELMLAAMSRTSKPTLLNHDQLDEPLNKARELAASYVKHAGWNQQQMLKAFGAGVSNASFKNWTRDLTNVALYNAAIEGKQAILDKFRNDLAVTDPDDRPVIVELLERFAP